MPQSHIYPEPSLLPIERIARQSGWDTTAGRVRRSRARRWRKEAGGRPTFLVGLFSKLRPQGLDGGQPKLVEQQAEARGIDRAHAASPIWPAPIRHS